MPRRMPWHDGACRGMTRSRRALAAPCAALRKPGDVKGRVARLLVLALMAVLSVDASASRRHLAQTAGSIRGMPITAWGEGSFPRLPANGAPAAMPAVASETPGLSELPPQQPALSELATPTATLLTTDAVPPAVTTEGAAATDMVAAAVAAAVPAAVAAVVSPHRTLRQCRRRRRRFRRWFRRWMWQ